MNLTRNYQPDKSNIPPEQVLKFVRSDNKYQSIWQYLRRYKNITYIKTRLQAEYPSLTERRLNIKSNHISSCVRQAEAFFDSSLQSDMAIKPLILYYGMLNLAKALIMFGDNEYTLSSPDFAQHGLNIRAKPKTVSPYDILVRKNYINLIDEYCYIQKGESIFKLFHACWSTVDLSADMRFNLKELISMHPDGWKAITSHYSLVPKLLLADGGFRTTTKKEHSLLIDPITQFSLYGKPASTDAWDFLESILLRLKTDYQRSTNTAFSFISKAMPSSIDSFYQIYSSTTGESYLIGDIQAGRRAIALTPLDVEFLIMFILGSLSRYMPQKWLKAVNYDSGVEMFILEGLINTMTISFPKNILEEFEGKTYTFSGNISTWG